MVDVTYNEAQFDKAVTIISSLPPKGSIELTTDQRLIFYKNFKQAKEGDDTSPKPGLFDFAGKAKWEARQTVKGQTKEESWTKYVAEFIKVVINSGDADAEDWIKQIELLG